jgi:hypothetical protein
MAASRAIRRRAGIISSNSMETGRVGAMAKVDLRAIVARFPALGQYANG